MANNRKYCNECKEIVNKERAALYAKEYAKKNREKLNTYNRKWYAENTQKFQKSWRKWRDKNKESYLERRREQYKNDPERHKKYAIEYYQRNRDECNEKSKEWKKRNPEQVKILKKRYYWRNREQILEGRKSKREYYRDLRRQWREKNRIHVRVKNRNRYALKMGAYGSHTAQEFEELCKSYNWECTYCRTKMNIMTVTEDHVIPLSRGGSNLIENIVPACMSCNISKSNKNLLDFLFYPELRKIA